MSAWFYGKRFWSYAYLRFFWYTLWFSLCSVCKIFWLIIDLIVHSWSKYEVSVFVQLSFSFFLLQCSFYPYIFFHSYNYRRYETIFFYVLDFSGCLEVIILSISFWTQLCRWYTISHIFCFPVRWPGLDLVPFFLSLFWRAFELLFLCCSSLIIRFYRRVYNTLRRPIKIL